MKGAMTGARRKTRRPVMRAVPIAGLQCRISRRINGDWMFQRSEAGEDSPNERAWERVHLPHSVRLEPLNASGGRNFQGVCWYRKRLDIAGEWKNRKVYLQVEGAMQTAEAWLNG